MTKGPDRTTIVSDAFKAALEHLRDPHASRPAGVVRDLSGGPDIAKAVAAVFDVAKASAATQDVAKASAATVSDVAKASAVSATDVAKAVAAVHDIERRFGPSTETAKAQAAIADIAKASAATQDIAKAAASSSQDVAKAAAAAGVDVAKASAAMQDIAKAPAVILGSVGSGPVSAETLTIALGFVASALGELPLKDRKAIADTLTATLLDVANATRASE